MVNREGTTYRATQQDRAGTGIVWRQAPSPVQAEQRSARLRLQRQQAIRLPIRCPSRHRTLFT